MKNIKFIVSALLAFLLVGCGGSSSSTASYNSMAIADDYASGSGIASMAYEKEAYAEPEMVADEEVVEPEEQLSSEKLVYTGRLEIETLEYEDTIANARSLIKKYSGIIENENESNSNYSWYQSSGSKNSRRMYWTVRIPTEHFDDFMNDMEGSGQIMGRSTYVENITKQYNNNEIRIAALEKQEARLLEMMDLAETVEEMIQIEDHLADVRYELENIGSQLRSYDNRVAYSTVYLDVKEVKAYTPLVQDSAFTRMTKGFAQSLSDLMHGLKEFAVWFVVHLPYLIFWGLIIALVIWLIRKFGNTPEARARREARKVKRMEKKAAEKARKEARRAAKANRKNPQNNQNPEA